MIRRLCYCPGVWDLLHQGHLNILERSRALGDCLVVGVVSDDGAAAYKRRPIQDEGTRLAVIKALKVVDAAVIQPTTDPSPILHALKPTPAILTHGDDWTHLREGHDTLERLGIEFVRLPYTPNVSTSAIIARLLEAGMVTA